MKTDGIVVSKDGTRIAYEQTGEGPPVVLVDGAMCRREMGPMRPLAKLLSERFTVVAYDRRGRGASQDAASYDVQREVEDLQAVAATQRAPVHVYGTSSGGALALRAASGLSLASLALFEMPLVWPGAPAPLPPDRYDEVIAHAQAGRGGDAVKVFMRMVGVPAFGLVMMRVIPGLWPKLTACAHTLPNDFAITEKSSASRPVSEALLQAMRTVRVPTLSLGGGKSPAYMLHGVKRVAETVPSAEHHVIAGQSHAASAKSVAPVLAEFFARHSTQQRAA